MEEGQMPISTVEEMASRYVADMRRIQPVGPYLIGGWSFGGLVAFEMAQQLLAAAEQVSLLVIFDASVPSGDANDNHFTDEDLHEPKAEHLIAWLKHYKMPVDEDEVRSMPIRDFAELYMNRSGMKGNLNVYLQLGRTALANEIAHCRYRPKPYPGRIALIRSNDPGEYDRGWGQIAPGNVDVYCFDASHNDMFSDMNVPALSAQLSYCLAEVAAEHAADVAVASDPPSDGAHDY
jgi:thioesterase domain-containing protein